MYNQAPENTVLLEIHGLAESLAIEPRVSLLPFVVKEVSL